MRWTVTCPPRVEEELSDLWLNAADRPAVTRAANTIERDLARDPLARGSEYGGYRAWSVGPVTVIYTVSPDDCLVSILHYVAT